MKSGEYQGNIGLSRSTLGCRPGSRKEKTKKISEGHYEKIRSSEEVPVGAVISMIASAYHGPEIPTLGPEHSQVCCMLYNHASPPTFVSGAESRCCHH